MFTCHCRLSLSSITVTCHSHLSHVIVTFHSHFSLSSVTILFNLTMLFVYITGIYKFCPLLNYLLTYLITLSICRWVFAPKNKHPLLLQNRLILINEIICKKTKPAASRFGGGVVCRPKLSILFLFLRRGGCHFVGIGGDQ